MQRSFAIIAICAAAATAAVAAYGFQRFSGTDERAVRASAIPDLEAATQRSPDNADAWKALGRAYRQAGRRDEAVNAYVRAARVKPNDREVIAALRDLAASR